MCSTQAANAPEPTNRLRLLSPFDPALRDRNRAEFLFGFYYRIEVFVPEAKRQYGYYVFPVLEGSRLIGRIDCKAFRDDRTLRVKAFWPEAGVKLGAGRISQTGSRTLPLGRLHRLRPGRISRRLAARELYKSRNITCNTGQRRTAGWALRRPF